MKQLLHIAGIAAALIATAVIVHQLSQDDRYLEVTDALVRDLPLLLRLCMLCALLNGLLCFGWAKLCAACGASISMTGAALLFARTHLYRYLPSNVLHFVGRHAALKSRGTSHANALLINTMEVGLQIISAVLLSVGLWVALPELPWGYPQPTNPLQAATLAVLVLGLLFISVFVSRRKLANVPALVGCLVIYLLFFVGCGVIAAQFVDAPLATVMLVAAIAWLGGALVPGASAGIGIRELILVSGLTPLVGPSEALTLALGFRLVTLGGDVLIGLVAWIIPDGQSSM